MRIKFWGTRGSIPVSGSEFVRFGGDTPCVEIRSREGEPIIVDCGSGLRRLGNSLLREGVTRVHLFLTHTHWDHILGFPFFKPLHDPDVEILLYGFPRWQGNTHKLLYDVLKAPHFPVQPQNIKARITYRECREKIRLPGMTVTPVPLSHPNLGVGYGFREGDKNFVFLTDNELDYRHRGGLDFTGYRDFCRGADLLVHDSEYMVEDYQRTRTWGHSRFSDAVRLAAEAKVTELGLFHHNQDRPDKGVLEMEEKARQELVCLGSETACFAVFQDQEIEL